MLKPGTPSVSVWLSLRNELDSIISLVQDKTTCLNMENETPRKATFKPAKASAPGFFKNNFVLFSLHTGAHLSKISWFWELQLLWVRYTNPVLPGQGCFSCRDASHALIAAKSLPCRLTSYLGMNAFPIRSWWLQEPNSVHLFSLCHAQPENKSYQINGSSSTGIQSHTRGGEKFHLPRAVFGHCSDCWLRPAI